LLSGSRHCSRSPDHDGSLLRGVDAQPFPAFRVEVEASSIGCFKRQGLGVDGDDREIGLLRDLLRLAAAAEVNHVALAARGAAI
jgi:hypothetical protein